MSFEGWYQLLCKAGHQDRIDAHEVSMFESPFDRTCEIQGCSEPIVWENLVDETNCCDTEPDGSHNPKTCSLCTQIVHLEINTKAVYKECPTCHHQELVAEETFKIPAADKA